MLNEGRRTELLYFLREVVLEDGVTEKESEPFLASLTAKGARESVDSAIKYLDSKIDEGFIGKESRSQIINIMRRFTKMR